jgi:hypothetical protein
VSLRSNRLLLFLGKAIALVILVAVVWTYISPAYNHLLVSLGNKIAPSGATLELKQRTIYFYHQNPWGGTDSANIAGWALEFGLVLVIALIGATPGLRLTQRLKFIGLAVVLLFVIHVLAIWIAAGLLVRRKILGQNPVFNFLVTLGCDLFPVVIWGILSLKYWFPEGLGGQPKLSGRESRKKKIKKLK